MSDRHTRSEARFCTSAATPPLRICGGATSLASAWPSPIGERPLAPFNHSAGKDERYYQQTAINRTVEAILKGDNRLLLTTAHLESCIEPAKVPKPVGQHPG
jgi:hypothetical protein